MKELSITQSKSSIKDLSVEEAEELKLRQIEWEHYSKNNQYRIDRSLEYPRLEEQLDYIYHYGVDAWKTNVIDPIKNKYPKPE